MLKVLIVEDEEIIRKGLVLTINWFELGCEVIGAAKDGVEGLKMIIETEPDIVIADIKMPFIDGLEMIEEAEKEVVFKSILLTSYTEFGYAQKGIQLQVSGYLLKPVNEEELKSTIERIQAEIDERKNYLRLTEMFQNSYISQLGQMDLNKNSIVCSNPYVKQAVNIILKNYKDKISIDSISKELGVSSSYLSRKFKETFGRTFLDVLSQYRVQQSMQLLNKGTYKIYEVSEGVGFNEYKHFCAVFKKYTDMAPSEFMKNKLF